MNNPLPALMARVEFNVRTAAALERVVAKDPAEVEALGRLGDTWRRVGDLRAACDAYRRLLAQRPDSRSAAWLCAVTGGCRLPAPPAGFRASPFVQTIGFLGPAEHDRVLASALALRESFRPATVGTGPHQREVRTRARVGWETRPLDCEALRALFIPRIRSLLPEVFRRLGLEGFEPRAFPLVLSAYPDGGFGKHHQDPGGSQGIACVYYFRRSPKAFSGGDLLLYDTDVRSNYFHPLLFSRLEPVDNSIVFFPTCYYHAVTPVTCPTRAFQDSRFAAAVWPTARG